MKETSRKGQAGTLESCDARVTIELRNDGDCTIEVEGPMKEVFGAAVKAVAERTLDRLGVKSAVVKIVDRGALDYVIEARTETAVCRAREGIES